MFSLRNKRSLMKKSVNLNKYGPFFIIFPLPVMLKFTVHITAVHLFTYVAKAVTSRRSRELKMAILPIKLLRNLFTQCYLVIFFLYPKVCRSQVENKHFFHLSQFVDTLSAAFAIIPTSNSHDYHVVSFGVKKVLTAIPALVLV